MSSNAASNGDTTWEMYPQNTWVWSAQFQHCMSHHVLEGLEENGVEMFTDDANAHSRDFEAHVLILKDAFKCCQ